MSLVCPSSDRSAAFQNPVALDGGFSFKIYCSSQNKKKILKQRTQMQIKAKCVLLKMKKLWLLRLGSVLWDSSCISARGRERSWGPVCVGAHRAAMLAEVGFGSGLWDSSGISAQGRERSGAGSGGKPWMGHSARHQQGSHMAPAFLMAAFCILS